MGCLADARLPTQQNKPMRETTKEDLQSALYGLLRLVSGYQDWKLVENAPKEEWVKLLIEYTTKDLVAQNSDPINSDPKKVSQLMRKLKAYQQVALLESFCFAEVEWD